MQIMIEQVFKRNALLAVPSSAAEHFKKVWNLKTLDIDEAPVPMWLHILWRDAASITPPSKKLQQFSTHYHCKDMML